MLKNKIVTKKENINTSQPPLEVQKLVRRLQVILPGAAVEYSSELIKQSEALFCKELTMLVQELQKTPEKALDWLSVIIFFNSRKPKEPQYNIIEGIFHPVLHKFAIQHETKETLVTQLILLSEVIRAGLSTEDATLGKLAYRMAQLIKRLGDRLLEMNDSANAVKCLTESQCYIDLRQVQIYVLMHGQSGFFTVSDLELFVNHVDLLIKLAIQSGDITYAESVIASSELLYTKCKQFLSILGEKIIGHYMTMANYWLQAEVPDYYKAISYLERATDFNNYIIKQTGYKSEKHLLGRLLQKEIRDGLQEVFYERACEWKKANTLKLENVRSQLYAQRTELLAAVLAPYFLVKLKQEKNSSNVSVMLMPAQDVGKNLESNCQVVTKILQLLHISYVFDNKVDAFPVNIIGLLDFPPERFEYVLAKIKEQSSQIKLIAESETKDEKTLKQSLSALKINALAEKFTNDEKVISQNSEVKIDFIQEPEKIVDTKSTEQKASIEQTKETLHFEEIKKEEKKTKEKIVEIKGGSSSTIINALTLNKKPILNEKISVPKKTPQYCEPLQIFSGKWKDEKFKNSKVVDLHHKGKNGCNLYAILNEDKVSKDIKDPILYDKFKQVLQDQQITEGIGPGVKFFNSKKTDVNQLKALGEEYKLKLKVRRSNKRVLGKLATVGVDEQGNPCELYEFDKAMKGHKK